VQDRNSYTKSWFGHAPMAQGGKIVLRMGAQPNEKFGAAVENRDRRPSFA
jgi:putative alpha-1,2-mannosidase